MNTEPDWYFTAPWEPVRLRRGDALGFRAAADHFADLLAPGLNNATRDARWITLLSWCLYWSHRAWQKAGGRDLSEREEQRRRYAWLRPLELLWIARALEFDAQKQNPPKRQLPGQRSVRNWLDKRHLPDFSMSTPQFIRYRQIGIYGAYRVVFRSVAGLTVGNDGWTPDETMRALAQLVDHSTSFKATQLDKNIKWGSWNGKENRFWIEKGWRDWRSANKEMLPTPTGLANVKLSADECRLLKPALFGDGSFRRITASILAEATHTTKSHDDLCEILAKSRASFRDAKYDVLALLPVFSRFTDAAMDGMRGLWDEIGNSDVAQSVSLQKLVQTDDIPEKLNVLRTAAENWRRTSDKDRFPHEAIVTSLAEAICQARTPLDQVRALIAHHQKEGGGRRWLYEQDGRLVREATDSDIPASDYRFRLLPLCRMAAQCGVADMRHALAALRLNSDDEEESFP